MDNIISPECEETLRKSISLFSSTESVIDIALAIRVNDLILVIIVFQSLPPSMERVVTVRLTQSIRSALLDGELNPDECQFNLRYFDKSIFLYSIAKFDPDILRYFLRDEVQLIIGDEYYNELMDNFISVNSIPRYESVVIPYLEDLFLSWEDSKQKYLALDIQLTRTLFNGLKLYSILNRESSLIELEELTIFNDPDELLENLKSIDFLVARPEFGFSKDILLDAFFIKPGKNYAQRKILLEEFLSQLMNWIFEWYENNHSRFDSEAVLKIGEMITGFIIANQMKPRYKFEMEKMNRIITEIS